MAKVVHRGSYVASLYTRHSTRERPKGATMPRPQPRFPEPDTEPFWKATKQHQLTYQTCDQDGTIIFPPRQHCSACGSTQTTWHTSKGEGVVYSYSVVRQNRNPAFKDLGAYAIAYVDLDEGF